MDNITAHRKFIKFSPGKTSGERCVLFNTSELVQRIQRWSRYWYMMLMRSLGQCLWNQSDVLHLQANSMLINILPFQPRWGWFVQRNFSSALQLVAPKRVRATWVIIRTNLYFPSTFKRLKGLSVEPFFKSTVRNQAAQRGCFPYILYVTLQKL